MTSKGKTLLNLEDKGEKSFLVKNYGNFYSFTVWKFEDLSAIQILREIDFGQLEVANTAILLISVRI